jgi:predicted metalloprotease with PDZ domain
LMLDDLLPQMEGKSAIVTIEPPVGWKIFTTETETSPGIFRVRDLEKAVFYLGKDLRVVRAKAPTVVISGNEWLFKDTDAGEMSAKIFDEYSKLFGPIKDVSPIVRIGRFPTHQMIGSWEADTRGQSVTIASMDTPFRSQSLQRLHEQLRHELFHLWVPGRLNLTGRYDWFYEGFAMYQSLKTGVAGNQIRFEDYLDTLSRARSIDGAGDRRLSLLDLSSTRWTGGNTRVYARGMLAAFVTDLAMMRASGVKRSVTDLIAAIVRKHSPPAAETDANAAILAEFRSRPELVAVVDKLITGSDRFDLPDLMNAAGLEVVRTGSSETIKMVAKPSGKQKDLLRRLGSENWRNLR